MFGIGMPELILIAVVALIVLGPKKLPDLAQSLGRALREFKKATSELKETLQVDSELTEVKKAFNEFQSDVNQTIQSEKKPEKPPGEAAAPAVSEPSVTPATEASPKAEGVSSAEKVEELNKAFDAWQAEKAKAEAQTGPGHNPAAETAPPAEKPKSTG
jgi:sec-independent protein translocase protein TatB